MIAQVRPSGAVERSRYRFTVDQYREIIDEGIVSEGSRVELLGGEIVEMSAMGDRHAASLEYFVDEVQRMLPRETVMRVETPIVIPPYDEPEPDVMIVRRRTDRYRTGKPRPADVLLVIEISNTSIV